MGDSYMKRVVDVDEMVIASDCLRSDRGEAVEVLRMFVAWDEAEKNAPRYDEDGGAHFRMMMKLCHEAFDRARSLLARLDGES